jgi:trk system potassium uptake protein TrkA
LIYNNPENNMRVVLIGASALAFHTAEALIENRHQVLIIEKDKTRIEELSTRLDCAFLHGDGSQPDLLREADPSHTDVLMCLTSRDQTNIIAGLVARNLGYARVVTVIEEVDFEGLCEELGLTETFIPLRKISHQLVELTEEPTAAPALNALFKHDAALRALALGSGEYTLQQLDLPEGCRVVGFYRQQALLFPDAQTRFQTGDELLILAQEDSLKALDKRLTAFQLMR